MNKHLNVFRHYAETSWENNLTRALGITLNNDPTFFLNFLNKITDKNIIDYFDSSTEISIDTQISIDNIPKDYEILYPIALTSGNIDISNIFSKNTNKPIADLVISINNICILIEVKITKEDCIEQLNNQVEVFKRGYRNEDLDIKDVIPLEWKEIIKIADTTYNFNTTLNNNSLFLKEFIEYIKIHYPSWMPVKKFHEIPLPKSNHNKDYFEIDRRIENLKFEISNGEMETYKSRVAVSLNKPWARELNIFMSEGCLKMAIWPGDTKGQGWHLFNMNPNLSFLQLHNEEKILEDISYQIKIRPYLKFSHFSKGITWFDFDMNNEEYKFNEIFHKISGRWKNEKWDNFKKIMTEYLSEDWMNNCEFENLILDSNRSYFDIAIGFEVSYCIKYSDIQEIEKKGTTKEFFIQLKDEMIKTIENK